MRSPQLVVYESESWIADLLRGTAGIWKWTLRELRQDTACLRVLRQGGPSVFVLELRQDLEPGLTLLERVTRLCPETASIVAASSSESRLTALAWDLGATYVLAPPHPRDALLTVVMHLMEAAQRKDIVPEPLAHE
jgi:DNA-binding NtrC family response regulator